MAPLYYVEEVSYMEGSIVNVKDINGECIKFGDTIITRNRRKYKVTNQEDQPFLVPLDGRGRLLLDKKLVVSSELQVI